MSMARPLSPLNNATVAVQKLTWKFFPMGNDCLHKTLSKSKADMSQCSNLQKGKEVISVIRFSDSLHSISFIQLAQHWQKVLDDAILLSTRYVVQSSASPDAFTNFMEILDGVESHFPPEIYDNLMLVV
jgi:hypothetical protein